MEGVQLYLEMIDFDSNSEDELIDRFVIDVKVPIGSSINKYDVRGIFGFAEISVNFEARCKPGYTCEFYTEDAEPESNNVGATLGSIGGVILLIILLIVVPSIVVCIIVVTRQWRKNKYQSSLPVNDPQFSTLVSILNTK